MCAKFGCGPTVVSKRGGGVQTDRQTDRQTKKTAALYSRCTLYRVDNCVVFKTGNLSVVTLICLTYHLLYI